MLRLTHRLRLKEPFKLLGRPASSWAGTSAVNTAEFPIDKPDSKVGGLVTAARSALKTTGCASFKGFLKQEAVSQAVGSALESVDDAFETDSRHNAYQIPEIDDSYAETHPRNVFMRTRVASTAYDELPKDGPLYNLYNSEGLHLL